MEIPERTVATVEVSDGVLPQTYTSLGELLRLHPAFFALSGSPLSQAGFSVRFRDIDPNLLTKLIAERTFAVRITATPYRVDCSASFLRGNEYELEFALSGEPVFSMVA